MVKFFGMLSCPRSSRNTALKIALADGIVFVHPDWWGMPPAILKGWIDRVLRPEVAYPFLEGDNGEGIPKGLLKAKTALVFNTSNTHQEGSWKCSATPLNGFGRTVSPDFCGIPVCYCRMFGVVVTSTAEQRKAWLDEVRELTRYTFPTGIR